MITHVILFKLKGGSKENIEKTRDLLLTLKDSVPVVRFLEAGTDVLRSERSYDIALTVRFDSLEDLEAYQKHPAHRKIADYVRSIREAAAVVDYES
ncbi:MAG: Dabb family protein [Deltaproteobacteria bacterium]|nr:Dabb family protein [Deltaproteobacteria bacterium]